MATEKVDNNCAHPKCIFCNIIRTDEPEKILFKDDIVVVFPDIKPAAKHHYLIVSREHIADVKHLDANNLDLVEHMASVAKNLLEDYCANTSSVRMGFHWPPFHSVGHLHMHAISPIEDMNFLSKCIFRPSNMWFVSPEYVLSTLKNCSPADNEKIENGKL